MIPILVDGREIPAGTTVETDLCIIGSGPAGITIALECMRTGLSVCVLESGGLTRHDVHSDLSAGVNKGYRYYNLKRTRARAFGGTSNCWIHDVGLRARPLDEIDFEARTAIPHSGWPLDRGELEPFYRRAQEICQLGPFHYDPDFWTDISPHDPLPELSALETPVFQFGSALTFKNHLDTFRESRELDLHMFSTVTEIVPNHSGNRVERLRVVSTTGSEHHYISARLYVLASGGLENPRLLLISRAADKAGLGNSHDLVGRYFMEHLALRTGHVRPTREEALTRAGFYQPHTASSHMIQGLVGLSNETVRSEGLRNAAFFLYPVADAEAIVRMARLRLWLITEPRGMFPAESSLALLRDPAPLLSRGVNLFARIGTKLPAMGSRRAERWLDSLSSTMAREPSVFQLKAMAEQSPNPDSRITLGNKRDRFGNPVPVLDWQISNDDLTSIRRTQDLIDEALQDAGWGPMEDKLPKIAARRPAFHGQWHHMGTTRMDRDPGRGVVDIHGRMHEVENLYIAGSSIFPTGGYANPTLTIVALALRLADRLNSVLAGTNSSCDRSNDRDRTSP